MHGECFLEGCEDMHGRMQQIVHGFDDCCVRCMVCNGIVKTVNG